MTTLSATKTNKFTYDDQIVTATVGVSGYYDITADGAQGGSGDGGAGGLGAVASGDIFLQAGAVLEIVAGGEGQTSYLGGGGGGGGSYVIEINNGSGAVDVNEAIAGGGGGGSFGVGGGGGGGGNGAGGSGSRGGGGGGFTGGAAGQSGSADGVSSATFSGGSGSNGGAGGFGGGGGGGASGGGGGGGYGGGDGGSQGVGGGGGSFINSSAILVSETAAANRGNGLVTISLTGAPPTIVGAGDTTYANAGSTTDTPFAGVTIGDPNPGSPTETLTIKLSDANGALGAPTAGPPGVTFTGGRFADMDEHDDP